jgi:hypothetical protein
MSDMPSRTLNENLQLQTLWGVPALLLNGHGHK